MALGATCCLLPQATRVRRQAATTPPSSQHASISVAKPRRLHVRAYTLKPGGKTGPCAFARQDGSIVCQARRLHRLPGSTPPSPSIQLTRLHHPPCATRFGHTCACSATHVHVHLDMCIFGDTCASAYPYQTCASPYPTHVHHPHPLSPHMCITHPLLPITTKRERERGRERERD
jgi:hypothetical protein